MDSFMDTTSNIKPPIVFDGANCAWEFSRCIHQGEATGPDTNGLLVLTLKWLELGHSVIIVLPRSYEKKFPQFQSQLESIANRAQVLWAPPGDDLFVISTAQELDGFILTNDKYRKEIEQVRQGVGEVQGDILRSFLEARTITYTFTPSGEAILHPITSKIAQYVESKGRKPAEGVLANVGIHIGGSGGGSGGSGSSSGIAVGAGGGKVGIHEITNAPNRHTYHNEEDNESSLGMHMEFDHPSVGGGMISSSSSSSLSSFTATSSAVFPPPTTTTTSSSTPYPSLTDAGGRRRYTSGNDDDDATHHHKKDISPILPSSEQLIAEAESIELPDELRTIVSSYISSRRPSTAVLVTLFAAQICSLIMTILHSSSGDWEQDVEDPALKQLAQQLKMTSSSSSSFEGGNSGGGGGGGLRLKTDTPEELAVALVKMVGISVESLESTRFMRGDDSSPAILLKGFTIWSGDRLAVLRSGLEKLLK